MAVVILSAGMVICVLTNQSPMVSNRMIIVMLRIIIIFKLAEKIVFNRSSSSCPNAIEKKR